MNLRSAFCFCVLVLFLSTVFGCGGIFRKEAARSTAYQQEQTIEEMSAIQQQAAPAPKKMDIRKGADMDQQIASKAPGGKTEKQSEQKRVYSGYCKLVVDSVEQEKTRISRLAEEEGGYVEGVWETSIVIRIPAEKFEVLFLRIQGFGQLLHKSEETYDVTEFFQDLNGRLNISLKTRERLYSLLEKTKKVEERLNILREIKRLTEEIERIQLTLDLLERQVALSRIAVDLVPRMPYTENAKKQIPFAWMATLDPLNPSINELKKKISIKLPEEFAIFGKEKIFRAESPEGTRVRIGTTANMPEGDSLFWQKALDFHLKDYYASQETLELGEFKSVLFTSKDRTPFFYLIGVSSKENVLVVAEVFFPDKNALEKNKASVLESLKACRVL